MLKGGNAWLVWFFCDGTGRTGNHCSSWCVLSAQDIQGGMQPRQLGMFEPEKLKFSLLDLFHGCFSR